MEELGNTPNHYSYLPPILSTATPNGTEVFPTLSTPMLEQGHTTVHNPVPTMTTSYIDPLPIAPTTNVSIPNSFASVVTGPSVNPRLPSEVLHPSDPHCTVLVVGDPHFKLANIADTEAMTTSILALAKLHQPHAIVILGDILDKFETMHISPFDRATCFLMDCLEHADTYLLIGNHDLKNNRQYLSPQHPFRSCHMWKHSHHTFTVVDNIVTRHINGQDMSAQMSFVPYVPPGMFETALNSNTQLPSWKDSRVIFAHQEFYGANYEVGSSTEGDKWPLEYPLVVSGHIHDYQRLQENILYVGTPIQHGYDDRHDKTISMFIFTETQWTEHRMALDVKKKTIRHITVYEVATYYVPDNEISKIVISGTAAEIKGINRHPVIKQWEGQGHKVTCKTLPNNNIRLCNTPMFNTGEQQGSHRPGFKAILNSKLQAQSHLLNLYHQVFGPSGPL